MVLEVSKSPLEPNIPLEVLMEMGYGCLISKIEKMKEESKLSKVDRVKQIKEKLDKNGKKLQDHINQLSATCIENSSEVDRLGVESALCIFDGFRPGSGDKYFANVHKAVSSKSTKFPKVQRIPPYTTWIFLDRNKKYHTDDDMAEMDEGKREFLEDEDRILWMAFQEHGFSEEVAEVVSHFILATSSKLLERGNELKLKFKALCDQGSAGRDTPLEKSLSAASDSYDNVFCRRCLVFDCSLHGCSQNLIYPSEKQSSGSEHEDKKPCSDQCYLLVGQSSNNSVEGSELGVSVEDLNAGRITGKRKIIDGKRKKLKKSRALDSTTEASAEETTIGMTTEIFSDLSLRGILSTTTCGSVRDKVNARLELQRQITSEEYRKRLSSGCKWNPLEKDLYTKGLEIFGRNSCLISGNMLLSLKTCAEVSSYMHDTEVTHKRDTTHSLEDSARSEPDPTVQELLVRPGSSTFPKMGNARRLKYSSKSNSHPPSWKRIGNGTQLRKNYTPCSCEFMCGKDCSCLLNGTCCEKYCGCSKSCKNRFRGCYCAKSQCRSRQCPCFAADRECDPDVCRSCWVSCGGGFLDEPDKKGDGQCENMKILLGQKKRVLWGISDVAGWGAFISETVNKNEYIGEYTGELISHQEADKRVNSAFLFNLNDQYVIDAHRQGNNLKFANHSSKPNCFAKGMLVAGDHRIGIFAKERIEAMEELFYDYCYGPEHKAEWAQKPESSKKDDPIVR